MHPTIKHSTWHGGRTAEGESWRNREDTRGPHCCHPHRFGAGDTYVSMEEPYKPAQGCNPVQVDCPCVIISHKQFFKNRSETVSTTLHILWGNRYWASELNCAPLKKSYTGWRRTLISKITQALFFFSWSSHDFYLQLNFLKFLKVIKVGEFLHQKRLFEVSVL